MVIKVKVISRQVILRSRSFLNQMVMCSDIELEAGGWLFTECILVKVRFILDLNKWKLINVTEPVFCNVGPPSPTLKFWMPHRFKANTHQAKSNVNFFDGCHRLVRLISYIHNVYLVFIDRKEKLT